MLYVVCCMMLLHVYALLLPAVCQFSSAAMLPKKSRRGENGGEVGSQLAGSLPALREEGGKRLK